MQLLKSPHNISLHMACLLRCMLFYWNSVRMALTQFRIMRSNEFKSTYQTSDPGQPINKLVFRTQTVLRPK